MQPHKPEASPWTEPDETSPAEPALQWRSSTLYRGLTPEEFRDIDDRQSALNVFFHAMAGTMLAGALFPTAILVVVLPFSFKLPGPSEVIGFLGFALAGGLFGGAFAFLAACVVFPFFALIQWLAGLHRWSVFVASCAGGWSGFTAVVVLLQAPLSYDDEIALVAVLAAGAMTMGQLGAAWMAKRARRKNTTAPPPATPHRQQLPLRQLFGITTAVAVAIVVVSSLPLPPTAFTMLGAAAAAQVLLVGGFLAIRALHHRRRADERLLVSRETLAAIDAHRPPTRVTQLAPDAATHSSLNVE